MESAGIEPIQCVYCLNDVTPKDVTEDHVIARSWYPANTPDVAKWKVPACRKCNNYFSDFEGTILSRIALCMDKNDPSVAHIVERALRSVDPKRAKSARDWKHRFNKRSALVRGLKTISNPTARGVLPSFRDNFLEGSRTGVLVPGDAIEKVVEKWIRGVHFCELGQLIPANYKISIQFVDDSVAEEAFAKVIEYATRIQKGPGIEV